MPLMLLAALCLPGQPRIETERVRVRCLSAEGRYVGWIVEARERGRWSEAARVTIGPGELWRAHEAGTWREGGRRGIELRGIDTSGTGGTPKLGADSFFRVSVATGEAFPRLEFRLNIQAFDQAAWEAAIGQSAPVCFCLLGLPTARVWYVHGLLCPTARLDPYPLSRPTIAGAWAKGWSYGAALGSLTVPAMAIWDDQTGRMVGYEWAEARLTDKSSKEVGIAYCSGMPCFRRQFLALLTNCQRRWHELTYPRAPSTIQARVRVIYSLHLPSTGDVNRLVLQHVYRAYEPILPRVPRMNDLSWMVPRQAEGLGLYGPSHGGIFHVVEGGKWGWSQLFFDAGTVTYDGNFRAFDQMYKQGEKEAIARFEKQLAEFLAQVRWREIGGDRCCFWRYPLKGSWKERMGGEAATTVHNVQQFGVGAAMLACYANTRRAELLRYIDGLLRWARHYIFTRGDIADIPESMFTLQTTSLAMDFLMNYAHIFADAPDRQHRELAKEAFRLAHMVVYRNANVTVGDSDERDALSGAFMMPGNMKSFWLGQISNAELCQPFRSMLIMHVETGDPVFKWLVRGALERWWIGFKEDCWHTAENIDIWGESTGTKGKQTAVHGPCDSFWEWAQPVGEAVMRVTCGAKAAIAFCKGTRALDIADYRYAPPNNFCFRIVRIGARPPHEPFTTIVSSPWRDLSHEAVTVAGRRLPAGRVTVLGTYHEHLLIPGVRIGDVVEIGRVGSARRLSLPEVPTAGAAPELAPDQLAVGGRSFRIVDLSRAANAGPARDWLSPDHYGGLPVGLAYAHGVPYWVIPADSNDGKWAMGAGGTLSVEGQEVYVFAIVGSAGRVIVRSGSNEVVLRPDEGLLAAEGWPLCKWKLRLFAVPLEGGRGAVTVRGDAMVVAVTTLVRGPGLARRLAAKASARRRATPTDVVLEEAKRRLEAVGGPTRTRIAFIPPHGRTFSTLARWADELGLETVPLTPAELVDPNMFSAARWPVAVYTGDERYYRTVAKRGDGEAALLRYLREGGTLVVAGICRPFTYAIDAQADGTEKMQRKPWVLLGKQFHLLLLGPSEQTKDAIGFERPPEGVELTMHVTPGQGVFWRLPARIAFPERGDQRYRPLTTQGMPQEDEVEPLIVTKGSDGRSYGPAAAVIRHKCQQFSGARVIWVWGTLLVRPFELHDHLAIQLLTYAAATSKWPSLPLPEKLALRLPPGNFRVAILPPDAWGREEMIKRACKAAGATPFFLTPDEFISGAFFNVRNFPVAIQAVGGERFIRTYRRPGDAEEAYKRYLREGGALVVCQPATPFWYELIRQGNSWQSRPPRRFWPMAFELGFRTEYGFEAPKEMMWLELTESGRRLWPSLPPRLELNYLRDKRWRWLVPYRTSAARRFVPLAYATHPDGTRYRGLAAAMIDFLESKFAGARLFYVWGSVVDGSVGQQILAGCIRYHMEHPVSGARRREER